MNARCAPWRVLHSVTRSGPVRFARGVPAAYTNLPKLGTGSQPEWLGKQVLAAIGIRTPAGALARSREEAVRVATRIGFPVVLKAQAGALAHKSEAGGVVLNLAMKAHCAPHGVQSKPAFTRRSPIWYWTACWWKSMSPRGVELVVGASRDAKWGPDHHGGSGWHLGWKPSQTCDCWRLTCNARRSSRKS